MLLKLFPQLDQLCTLRARHHFFQQVRMELCTPPRAVDRQFGHDQYYRPVEVAPFDLHSSSLLATVNPEFHGKQCRLFYSIWLTGDYIRIGALMDNEAALAPLMEGQLEINHIWPNKAPETQDRDGMLMYQWSFEIPGLLDRWSAREFLVEGIRHMHFRLMRILHDGLKP